MNDLGWALVKPTLSAKEYIPVEVVRRGKRFTFVRTLNGQEWRYTTRGLWDGFKTEEDATAKLEELRSIRVDFNARTLLDERENADVRQNFIADGYRIGCPTK